MPQGLPRLVFARPEGNEHENGGGETDTPTRRFADGSPLPDYDRRATDDNDTAVRRGVTHSSCHQISNQYGGRTHGNRIGWSNTRAHVRGARRRLTADQDGRTTGRQDRSTNVGDRRCTWSDHRASVHVTYSGGWRHSCFSFDLVFSSGIQDRTDFCPDFESSASSGLVGLASVGS